MDRPLYSLHLFAGAGGGILADILAGVQPVCAVELEPYPQRVLSHRFPGLPVWDDVQTFRADNPDCADAFAWMREHRDALVVAGGFPCQDISCAGKGGGVEGGERSGLWREFARILGEVRPRFAFVENSPFLAGRGLGIVLGDLAALGYDARWQVLAAGDVGARHLRERIWIAAARGGHEFPTPCCIGLDGGSHVRERARRAISAYPTPQAHDAVAGTSRPHGWGGAQRNLTDLAAGMQYPTPRAHDRLPGGGRI